VIGVDLIKTEDLGQHHTFIRGDIRQVDTLKKVLLALQGRKCDVVISDLSPNLIGRKGDDHLCSAELCCAASDFMERCLATGGSFVIKMFQGRQGKHFKSYLKTRFKHVWSAKPDASRDESREMYWVAQQFYGRPSVQEEVRMSDLGSVKVNTGKWD